MKTTLFFLSLLVSWAVSAQQAPSPELDQRVSALPDMPPATCDIAGTLLREGTKQYPDFLDREPFVLRLLVYVEETGEVSDAIAIDQSRYPGLSRLAVGEMKKCKFSRAGDAGNLVGLGTIFNIRVNDRFVVKSYARCPYPQYPPEAIRTRREGYTRVRVFTDDRGTPSRTELIESSGTAALDAAALRSTLECRPLARGSATAPPNHSFDVGYDWRL
jgi:TonB family protein